MFFLLIHQVANFRRKKYSISGWGLELGEAEREWITVANSAIFFFQNITFFAMRKPKNPKSYIQTQQPYLALSFGLTNNLEKWIPDVFNELISKISHSTPGP